jgi:hypothetical protein
VCTEVSNVAKLDGDEQLVPSMAMQASRRLATVARHAVLTGGE